MRAMAAVQSGTVSRQDCPSGLAARVELEYSLTGMARNPWELVWSDEFDSAGPPNPQRGKHQVRPPHFVQPLGLIERQHFAPPQLGNARVRNGHVRVYAKT